MDRSPLREIEDTKPFLTMECKREATPIKDEDKENIEVTHALTRKSFLRNFDPFYSSPVCIKEESTKEEQYNGESTFSVAVEETYDTAFNLSEHSTSESNRHNSTLYDSATNLSVTEQNNNEDCICTDLLDPLDTDNCSLDVAKYILNLVVASVSPETVQQTFADMSEMIAVQEQELSDLKLQLNQCQQLRATLELQVRQKEEVIIKTEAEFQRREAQYKQELKQLKDKLDENKEDIKDDETKKLRDTVEKMKVQEKKLLDELNALTSDKDGFKHIMDEYEKTISQQLSETEKLKREHDTVKRHLATLELAFSDVHQKYERSKTIIAGYKNNEDTMQQSLLLSNETIKKNEEKYDSLKAHAKAQIDKSNKELNLAREKSQSEFHKLTAIIKRLEIKNASLVNALDQKTKECTALAALCDEVTGHVE